MVKGEEKMAAIVTQVEIDRPQEEVFAYVTDPARFPEWQQNVLGGYMAEGQTGAGAECVTTRRIGGAERTVTSKVTHVEPPRTWGVYGIDGPIRSRVNVVVEPVPGRTASRVTIELDFEGFGIGRVLVPLLVRPQSRGEMRRNVARLKAVIEGTGAA